MNRPSVHKKRAVLPWRKIVRFSLPNDIEIGCAAAVAAKACLFLQIAVLFKFAQRTLGRAAGNVQVRRNRPDPRPALAMPVRAVMQIHIDRFRSVGKSYISIDFSEKAQ